MWICRLDLSKSKLGISSEDMGQLKCMTHLHELVLPQPLSSDASQACIYALHACKPKFWSTFMPTVWCLFLLLLHLSKLHAPSVYYMSACTLTCASCRMHCFCEFLFHAYFYLPHKGLAMLRKAMQGFTGLFDHVLWCRPQHWSSTWRGIMCVSNIVMSVHASLVSLAKACTLCQTAIKSDMTQSTLSFTMTFITDSLMITLWWTLLFDLLALTCLHWS